MPQDLVKIQVEQPQKDTQELENLDGFRFEADICMSKLDIPVWQPFMALALVPLAIISSNK